MSHLLKTITIAAAVMSAAGVAAAEAGRESFSLEFRFDPQATPEANYAHFLHRVKRACTNPGPKPLAVAVHENACVDEVMDQMIARMGRADLASVHFDRTGRHIDASRSFAAK
jgi:hypothetical protein